MLTERLLGDDLNPDAARRKAVLESIQLEQCRNSVRPTCIFLCCKLKARESLHSLVALGNGANPLFVGCKQPAKKFCCHKNSLFIAAHPVMVCRDEKVAGSNIF